MVSYHTLYQYEMILVQKYNHLQKILDIIKIKKYYYNQPTGMILRIHRILLEFLSKISSDFWEKDEKRLRAALLRMPS